MRFSRLNFNILSTDLSTGGYRVNKGGHVMGYRSHSRTNLRSEESSRQKQFRPKARDILVSWARAREYRKGEASYLELARSVSDPDARDRFIGIAQHYRSLAKIEQSMPINGQTNLAATEPFGLRVKACSHWLPAKTLTNRLSVTISSLSLVPVGFGDIQQ
jgi:hypothetical protein